jgi:cell division protein FtsQ
MDERIKQRRIEVTRAEGRRRLRFLIGLAGVLALIGGLVAASRSPLLDVDRISISGDVQTGRPQTLRALHVLEGDLMLDVDAGAAERRLEALPWVAHASVTRAFPGTLRVRVVERQVAAAVPAAGERWALVDTDGHVIDVLAEAPSNVVRVTGTRPVTRSGDRLAGDGRAALVVAGAMPADLRERVPEVTARGDGIELHLAPAGVVRFGRAEALGPKFQALATLFDRVDLAGVSVIDLRVPDAPVLTRA